MRNTNPDLKTNYASLKSIQPFNGFTTETGDFFWDLILNNNRTWFQENREDFEKLLNIPFKSLAAETTEIMVNEYPLCGLECHVSRIYRDARRLYGRGPYKESLWFSIKNRAKDYEGPSFFFEISPRGWCYGMGFYCPRADQMENFRKSIDVDPARFYRIAAEIAGMPEFIVEGEEYKRSKGDHGEIINKWYNKKWVSAVCNRDFDGEIFSPSLPEFLAKEFSKLMPMYEYLTLFVVPNLFP